MFHKYLTLVFQGCSISMVSTSLTDPRCAEICAAKNKVASSKKSIYANMLKSKDTSCLVTCYLTDKGISGTVLDSASNSLSNNIILTKNTGKQNTNTYTANINSLTTSKSSEQQSQVNTTPVNVSSNGALKQTTLNTPLFTPNTEFQTFSQPKSYISPNSSNISYFNSYPELSTSSSPNTVSNASNVSNQTNTYTSFNNDNIAQVLSDTTKEGETTKTYLLTTGKILPDTTNRKTQNINTSSPQLQIEHPNLINEMIRNHHEKTLKQINIRQENPKKETLHSDVKETSFVLQNKAKLYKDLNKLDSLIKKEETHPISLYNEANKLKREEIEENTAKLIDEANRFPDNAHTSLSHTRDSMESEYSSSSEEYEFSDSEEFQPKKRHHRHRGTHNYKERRQKNDNAMSLNRKEKELKNEVLKNVSIKKQLADSDLIITEPTKEEYKNINPDHIVVGITPLGHGRVLTSENTTTGEFANEMGYENLNANDHSRIKRNTPSSLFGPQIEFLGGLKNTHNENMNGEFLRTSTNSSFLNSNTTDTSQNIDNSNNLLLLDAHRKLIELENQIIDLQNIHKKTVENIHKQEIINQLNSINRHTGGDSLLAQHQGIEEQLVNEALQSKQEEINRQIEEERRIHEIMEEERRIQERETGWRSIEESPEMAVEREISRAEQESDIKQQQMEEERRIQEATVPIENPLNGAAKIPPPVIQTEQELIQTPTETVSSQMQTVESVPHESFEVPPIIPTPPINSNNIIYSARNRLTTSYNNNQIYTTGLTDVII